MNRPLLWNPPLWGSLILTAIALLVSSNAASPLWLRTLLWIGLSLYNALWWLLQVPDYPTFQNLAAPPEEQQELARLKHSIFMGRLSSAIILATLSGIMLLVFWASPAGVGPSSLAIYAGVLLIALVLGVLSEWRRYHASGKVS
jgi:hypothetical protein